MSRHSIEIGLQRDHALGQRLQTKLAKKTYKENWQKTCKENWKKRTKKTGQMSHTDILHGQYLPVQTISTADNCFGHVATPFYMVPG